MNKTPVVWLTGMSGSVKTTLATWVYNSLSEKGYKVEVIDGDSVRERDGKKLGFGTNDVWINNQRIAKLAMQKRKECDVVLIPVISPYEEIRQKIRKILEPNFHLIYLKVEIDTLKKETQKAFMLLLIEAK